MSEVVRSLLTKLTPDPWRSEVGFSKDIEETNQTLFSSSSVDEMIGAINKWLFNNQPCLFGKIAARRNLLSYCILTEDDLCKSDGEIREKIQGARLNWYQML